jgi:hypothetical protein
MKKGPQICLPGDVVPTRGRRRVTPQLRNRLCGRRDFCPLASDQGFKRGVALQGLKTAEKVWAKGTA